MTINNDKFGNLYGEQVPTPIGRLDWPSLEKPQEDTRPPVEGQVRVPKYRATVLLDKKDPKAVAWVEEREAEGQLMVKQMNKSIKARGDKTFVAVENFVLDGDEYIAARPERAEKMPYVAGHYMVMADHKDAPQLFDKSGEITFDYEAFKRGIKARIVVTLAMFKSGPKFKLAGVQFVKDDGISFGSTVRSAKSLLGAIDDDGDEIPVKKTKPALKVAEVVEEEEEVDATEEGEEGEEEAAPPIVQKAKPAVTGKKNAVNLLA